MRRLELLFIYIIMCTACAVAAKKIDCKAVAKVVSFNQAGDTLAQGNGFFVSPDGEAVVAYNLLKGASRVELTDWKSRVHTVRYLLGASSTYDLCRVKCEAKKLDFLPVATEFTDTTVLLQTYYSQNKKSQVVPAEVHKVDSFENYKYFSISTKNEDNFIGCPVLNHQGEVVAIVQRNLDKNAENACAIDVRFATDLKIGVSAAMNADLHSIKLLREIPADEEEAYNYMYLLSRVAKDSVQFVNAADLFLQRYPKNARANIEIASFYASHSDYQPAEDAINRALLLAENKDEVHSALSDIIYQKALYDPKTSFKDWELPRALSEAEEAYSIKPDTAYIVQQAHCLYGLERYKEASDKFVVSARYSKQPAEMYFYAANALERAQGDSTLVLDLLSNAVQAFPRPYAAEAAPYLLTRAQQYEKLGEYRNAVRDYNEYEKAIGAGNLTARFYDIRQAAEQKARMFQQAIDDLHTAAALSSTDNERGLYLTEAAYIYLQVGMNEEAIAEAEEALKLVPGNSEVINCIEFAKQQINNNKK